MKKTCILVFALFGAMATLAQQQAPIPHPAKRGVLRQRIFNAVHRSSGTANAISSAQALTAHHDIVWDLGTYPGGTWAEMGGVNDFGVAVAQGDTASNGQPHLFKIQLLGPNSPKWTDMGAINSNQGWFDWPSIADTGLIVGHVAMSDGNLHASLWRGKYRIDLGTLADIGYASFDNSDAALVNKLGTLICGSSWSSETGTQFPVVWRLNPHTGNWKIHKLDTLEFPNGFALTVNDFGQVAGGFYDDTGVYVAALWNPIPGEEEWKAINLPGSPDWPDVAIVGDINEKGEMVGDVLSPDWMNGYSSLWQPVDATRQTYKLTLLPNYWNVPNGDTAEGINDFGDIVGGSWDQDFVPHAVRWTTKDVSSVQLLDFPGDYSVAYKASDGKIATGLYGIDDTEHAYAVKLP